MSTQHTTSGITVTEYEEEDTLDLELTAPTADEQAWEDLAAVYADGSRCAGCMFDERGANFFTGRLWRECAALHPSHCPVLNPATIANALRRQAS
jgi:hypothetical protein